MTVLICAGFRLCFAQSPKLVECPKDRVYRDNRIGGEGGEVYCEHVLPGSLVVKDGPYRFWFNRDFEGAAGTYNEGREVGKWKECDRFGRCKEKDYPAIYPEEKQRPDFRPEIPLAYAGGKYVFDFAACRSTRVTHIRDGRADLELNIAAQTDGCFVGYFPEAFIEHGGGDYYTCTIPFRVGRQAVASLDLMSELPKLGLPQYCAKPILRTGPSPGSVAPSRGGGAAQVFTAEYSLGNNGVGISQARLHFQESAASRTNRCVVRYDPGTKHLYLLSDQPGKFLGPITAGGKDSLWNGRCLLSGCSNAEVSGGTLKVHFAIRFNPTSFAGPHHMFVETVDTDHQAGPATPGGLWEVPEATSRTPSAWPSDRSCPVPMLVRAVGFYTSAPVNCSDVTGAWDDPENGGRWTLSQTGGGITGSLMMFRGELCGTVSWQVAGRMDNGVAMLTAASPSPSVDKCGVTAAASITANRMPYCNTSEQTRGERGK